MPTQEPTAKTLSSRAGHGTTKLCGPEGTGYRLLVPLGFHLFPSQDVPSPGCSALRVMDSDSCSVWKKILETGATIHGAAAAEHTQHWLL